MWKLGAQRSVWSLRNQGKICNYFVAHITQANNLTVNLSPSAIGPNNNLNTLDKRKKIMLESQIMMTDEEKAQIEEIIKKRISAPDWRDPYDHPDEMDWNACDPERRKLPLAPPRTWHPTNP
jgi:hypothetical protein